jgi:hypothetical protein
MRSLYSRSTCHRGFAVVELKEGLAGQLHRRVCEGLRWEVRVEVLRGLRVLAVASHPPSSSKESREQRDPSDPRAGPRRERAREVRVVDRLTSKPIEGKALLTVKILS